MRHEVEKVIAEVEEATEAFGWELGSWADLLAQFIDERKLHNDLREWLKAEATKRKG